MKRILSFLLAFALLAGLVVLPVAAKPDVTPVTELCPHCNTAWDACDWQPIDSIDLSEDILSGHYYLTEDTALSALFGLGTKDGQTADYAVDVCLDLRGYDMTREKKDTRVAYVYDYSRFAVMDTVGGGVLSATGDTVGGAVYIAANGEFHLYSGTILTTSTGRTKNGGVIYGTTGSYMYIHGGMIDATGVSANVESGTPVGGGLYVGGYGEINGGMILGGYMKRGGSIYVSSAGTLYVNGGYIYGGEASENGGNICNYGDTFVTGGEIIGGVSGNNGGNIFSGYSNSDIKLYSDLHISGGYIADGRASSNGSNVMFNSANGSITGGTIKGNVYINTAVILSGSPVIDNFGYEGLYATASKKLVIKDLNADARIILRGNSTVTDTATSPDVATYLANGQLIPASRYALTMTDGVLTSSQDDEGYCPHCEKNVTWKKYTANTNTSGHYYTASGGFTAAAGSAALNIAADVDIVLNIAHSTVKAGARYYVDGKLTILSSATNVISFYNTKTSTDENGAAIFVSSTGTLNMYDGLIKGTTTSGNGGAVYVNRGTFNMYGGTIVGGTATNGGSIYAYNTGTKVNMYGGVITGGSATNSAGNVFVGTATFNMYDGVIENGTATSNGGNIQAGSSGVANIRGGMLLGGKATNYGGNFYTASTSSKLNMYDGIMQNGSAKNGGNIYANNGVVSITGGTIQNGVASTYGGNIYNNNGKYFVDNGGDLTKNYMIIGDNNVADDIAAPVLLGGKANYGGNLYNTGYATLGACTFLDGEATYGNEIYYGKVASITVKPDFTQTIAMYVHADLIKELEATGTLLKAVCTELNATIYVENYDMALLIDTAGGLLGLAGASLVSIADGALRWFKTAQEAADACTSEEFIRLYGTGHSLQLKGDTILDVNGAAVTVTGSGKLYGFDSRNDSYKTYGTVDLSGMEVENPFTAPNGNTYIAVTDEEGTSFHRVDMVISDVVLRPSVAGLYYKAKFRCDEKLTDFVTSFGVAVSTVDRPGTDFETDSDTLYASFAGSTLGTEACSSVLVQDILKDTITPVEAKARGEKFVFAGAFMKLSVDGEEVVVLSRDQSPWSLKTVLEHLNTYWRTLPEADKTALMDSIYTPYISQFDEDWGLFYMRYTYRDMTPEEEAVLEARRQTVLDYMRSSLTLLWTPTETLTYGLAQRDNGTTLKVVAGRIYQGVPYAYAVGTEQSFLEYAVAQNEKGIYTISNLEATALNYEAYGARVGNDCSGAVCNAWSQIGTSFTTSRSATMLPSYGALPAGDYDFCPTINYESNVITYTAIVNKTNGEQRMYEAYAELLPADAVFYVATSGSNHIRMVSEVYVARNSDGTIDGANSYIKVLEQTRSNQTAGKTKTVEGIGTVYVVGGVDVKYTFEKLFSGNYIPCTIKELRDPTPVEETWIQDTQVVNTAENLFEGVIMSNRYIDCVTITIEDVDGNVVQQTTGRARRRYNKEFYLNRFVIENAGARIGVVDLSALESGQYRCKITARLTIGDTYVVRDFNFEK